MYIEGQNYRLTKHGRKRFLERSGFPNATDNEVIRLCVGNPRALWKPDESEGFRLVTFLWPRPERSPSVQVKFKRLEVNAKMPTRAYNSAGWDLYPLMAGKIIPGEVVKIPLGFATEFDPAYVAVIDDRGSVGSKGVTHLAGVIDADYRGEWGLIFVNLGAETFEYRPEKAIGQALFLPVMTGEFVEVDELSSTERGAGAFGSSDKK